MLLCEFTDHGADPLLVKLVAVVSQLKGNIDTRKAKNNWTVDELLDYLKSNDVILDKDDLYDMIKNPPMNNIISNIQGDNVVFKGHGDSESAGEPDEEKKKAMVKAMAKHALEK